MARPDSAWPGPGASTLLAGSSSPVGLGSRFGEAARQQTRTNDGRTIAFVRSPSRVAGRTLFRFKCLRESKRQAIGESRSCLERLPVTFPPGGAFRRPRTCKARVILSARDNRTASEALRRGSPFCVALAEKPAAPAWNASFSLRGWRESERLGCAPSYGGSSFHHGALFADRGSLSCLGQSSLGQIGGLMSTVPSTRRSGTCTNPAKQEGGP